MATRSLLRVEDVTTTVEPLGATIDDAAGEAFDKVARLLGLPFPGGPHIDRAAASGSSVAIDFPRGLTSRRDLERHRFDFSFSGLKTAVARWVEARERSGEPVPVADVAASFQEAVCDVLVRKALDAATSTGVEDLLIGGGVAANSRLRAMAEERAAAVGVRVRVPRPGLCTDNGAMVAALGSEMVARGRTPSALDLPADSSQPVTTVLVYEESFQGVDSAREISERLVSGQVTSQSDSTNAEARSGFGPSTGPTSVSGSPPSIGTRSR